MLRLRTLGALSLESTQGEPVPIAAQRARLALLAVLASAGEAGMSRDRLHALFWPDKDTEHARGALNQAVYVLRRELRVPELMLGTNELRLNGECISTDVGQFEAALRAGDWREAVAHYGGEFLPGVHLANGEFARWRDTEADRLARRYREALVQLARDAEAEGDVPAALRHWGVLAAADPFSAPTALGVMQAFVRAGDRTAAIRHGSAYAQRVRAELDLVPDSGVTRLIDQLTAEARRDGTRATTPSQASGPAPADIEAASPGGERSRTVASDAERAAPMKGERRRARGWPTRVAFVALVAVFAGGGSTFFRPVLDPDGVAVRVERASPPGAADATRHAIEATLLSTVPGLRVRRRWGGRPRYAIEVEERAVADSVHLTARVRDAERSLTTPIDAVMVPSAARDAGARALAEQVAVAIASSRDSLFFRWAYQATLPRTLAGYRALEAAMREWQPPALGGSRALFERATALDSLNGTAPVLLALSLAKVNDRATSDSIFAALGASGRRLGAFDRAIVAVVQAWNRGDLSSAHAAGHRLLEVVPGSEWTVMVAYDALGVGRAREALALLASMPPAPWAERWVDIAQHQALLLTRDFAGTLAHAEAGLRREPESRFHQQAAAKALAALGRVEEVEAICAQSLAQRFNYQPCQQSVMELRGHGHYAAARRVADRFLAALDAADSLTRAERRLERGWMAVFLGDWPALERELRTLRAEGVDERELRRLAVYAAAARGDRGTVRRALAGAADLPLIERASILAIAGSRDEAVEALAAALRAGFRRGFSLNAWTGFDRLRGYPSFDTLVAPRDDAAHRATVLARTSSPRS